MVKVYTRQIVHTVKVHLIGHTHRGTYTQRGPTHGATYTEQPTHGATYTRRDIHTEKTIYNGDIHMTYEGDIQRGGT